MNPDIDDGHRLRGWYDSVGHNVDYSEYKREGASGAAGGNRKGDWMSGRGVEGD